LPAGFETSLTAVTDASHGRHEPHVRELRTVLAVLRSGTFQPHERALHFGGTTLALGAVAAAISVAPWWLAVAPAVGYAFAWIGHLVFEKNRPATLAYPLWSLRADFRMYRYIWLGRMAGEVRRAQECLAAQRR
jgi:hypothetical protein